MNRKQNRFVIRLVLPGRSMLRTLALFALLCSLLFSFVPATGQAVVSYPDLQGVGAPEPRAGVTRGVRRLYAAGEYTVSPAATTPAFAEWTRTGGPDDTLVATGYQFTTNSGADAGKDTGFTVFGQTNASNGALAPAKIQRLDGDNKVAVTLDSTLPTWSMYLLWPQNSNGYGYPIAVNRTEAWWLGPQKAAVGDTISVYGRNLSNQNGTSNSWLYIKPSGSAGQWVTPTAVNPYKVDFVVPTLANGSYEVWVHNGHGGHYGWSGPLTLTVYGGPGWTNTQFNVKDYGAVGDGVTDDTAAIEAALEAAAGTPYSTVYFPTGTYSVSDGFIPPSNVRLLGDGETATTIECNFPASNITNTSDPRAFALFCDNGVHHPGDSGTIHLNEGGTRQTNVEFNSMTLDANNNLNVWDGSGALPTLIYMEGTGDLRFTHVAIKAMNQNYSGVNFDSSLGVHLTNCDIYGGGGWMAPMYVGSASQVFIDHCNFYGTYDSFTFIDEWGAHDLSVTNCTAQDYDNTTETGWAIGRFLSGNGDGGTSVNTYIGNNTTNQMTVRPDCTEQNAGEQCMWEGNVPFYRGSPTAATATTVTFNSLSGYPPNIPAGFCNAVIVAGKGVGQHRVITNTDYTNGIITVSPAWNVTPDATSVILLAVLTDKVAIYNNYFNGKPRVLTDHIGSAGVEPYGGCTDMVVDHNTFDTLKTALSIWAQGNQDDGFYGLPPLDIHPVFFHLYTNNTIKNCYAGAAGILGFLNNPTLDVGTSYLGITLRRNNYDTLLTPACTFSATDGSWSCLGTPMNMNVIEHETATNVPGGIDTSGVVNYATNLIAYKNNLATTAAPAGATGFNFGAGENPALQQNVWTNFATPYAGTPPGAVLELPYRSLTASTTPGGSPAQVTLSIWNSGTSAMNWTATQTIANWLTLSATSGTAQSENHSSILLTCNPAGLTPGIYPATITVAAGSQTMKCTVIFTVEALQVSTTALTVYGPDAATPQTNTITITNPGAALLNWTATVNQASQGWLSVPTSSGSIAVGGSTPLKITCNPAHLVNGTYSGTITVAGGGQSVQITVTFTFPVSPVLQVSPTNWDVTCGDATTPVHDSLTVSNIGQAPLTWSAVSSVTWLSVSPTGSPNNTPINPGGNSMTVTATCNPTGLAPGTYQGRLTFTGGVQAQVFGVTFTVPVWPVLQVSPTALTVTGVDAFTKQTSSFTVNNPGNAALSWTLSVNTANAGWLSVSLTKGTTSANSSTPVTVTCNPTGLAPGAHTGTITFTAGGQTSAGHRVLRGPELAGAAGLPRVADRNRR